MNLLILIIVAVVSFLVGMVVALCVINITEVVVSKKELHKNLRELREKEIYIENKKLKEMLKEIEEENSKLRGFRNG